MAEERRGTGCHCACWEVGAEREEAEGLLSKTREENPGVMVQLFGAAEPPNPAALEMVASQTLAAARAGSTLAEKPELDLLLRLAGTRQIGEAFRRVGYKSGGKRLYMVAASEGSAALERMGRRLAKDRRFVELGRRELSKSELDAVERAALLAARV